MGYVETINLTESISYDSVNYSYAPFDFKSYIDEKMSELKVVTFKAIARKEWKEQRTKRKPKWRS